jgi:hypothetical protein
MCRRFRTLSLFHLLNKKNNWDEIAGVFIQVKVYLKRSLGQLEWGRMGRGHVRVEEQDVEGSGSKWRPVVRRGYKGEMALSE